MEKFIGFKLIQAEPQWQSGFVDPLSSKEGYKVVYPDGYISWCPKEVFEKAYLQIGENNTITQSNVNKFIKDIEVSTISEKTTLMRVTLVNGFEIIESSSCVDKANYDEAMGAEICLGKIKNKIWELLGFLLQTAKEGV